jgi:Domain of unknown function (DUF927)
MLGQHTWGIFRASEAFSAPLLKIAGHEGGGFHSFGPSSDLKSILDGLAQTVAGRGGRGGAYGRRGFGTAAGIEGIVAGHNNLPLFLDDVTVVDPHELVKIVYGIVAEEQKARRQADLTMHERPPYRVHAITNGEFDIPAVLAKARIEAPGGLAVRFPGVPAIGRGREAGEPGAALDVGMTATERRAFPAKATRAMSSHYGMPIKIFVCELVVRKLTDGTRVLEMVEGFVQRAGGDDLHPQVVRVALKAGLVGAAGELAIEFGIAPWPVGSAMAAADYVFQKWLEYRGTDGAHEMLTALRRLKGFFEQYGDSRFETLSAITLRDINDPIPGEAPVVLDEPFDPANPPLRRAVGDRPVIPRRHGWKSGEGETRRWYIAEQTWKDEFCKSVNPKSLNAELAKRKVLELSTEVNRGMSRERLKRIMINGKRLPYIVLNSGILQVANDPLEGLSDA